MDKLFAPYLYIVYLLKNGECSIAIALFVATVESEGTLDLYCWFLCLLMSCDLLHQRYHGIIVLAEREGGREVCNIT